MIAGAVAGVAGVLTWTFFEYVIHRWLGHDRRFRRNPAGVEHIRHHLEGDYFAPSWKKAMIAVIAIAILSGPAILIAGRVVGLTYVVSLIGFYGIYELQHRRKHTHAGLGWYGRWARRHHFYHHLVDGRANFGVTSPLWDLVFGTYRVPGIIKVPSRLAMVWLIDPATGAVHADHAGTYVLGKQRTPSPAAAAYRPRAASPHRSRLVSRMSVDTNPE